MNKLYAVAVSQQDQGIELQIVEAGNKIEAIWGHDAVTPDEVDDEMSLISLMNEVDQANIDVKYKDVRSFLAERNILVTVTKICD